MRLSFCYTDAEFSKLAYEVSIDLRQLYHQENPNWILSMTDQDIKAFSQTYNERHVGWARYIFSAMAKLHLPSISVPRILPVVFGRGDRGLAFFDRTGHFKMLLINRTQHDETLVFYQGDHPLQIIMMMGQLKTDDGDSLITGAVTWKSVTSNAQTLYYNQGGTDEWKADYTMIAANNLIKSCNQSPKGCAWDPISIVNTLEVSGSTVRPSSGVSSLPTVVTSHFTKELSAEGLVEFHRLRKKIETLTQEADDFLSENFNWRAPQ